MTIISILAALLLPVLSKAVTAARQVSCANRMKNFYLATGFYRDDYAFYPVSDVMGILISGWEPGRYNFGRQVKPYLQCTTTNYSASTSTNIFWCPASGYQPHVNSSDYIRQYGYNDAWSIVGNYWTTAYFGLILWGSKDDWPTNPGEYPPRCSIIQNHSKVILLGELKGASQMTFGQYRYTRACIFVHSQRTNFTFVDGHISCFPWVDIYGTSGQLPAKSDIRFTE